MRINTIRLRVVVGAAGMLLPWIVALLVWDIPASISATWYTNAGTVFMIILGGASGLLICYKGYDLVDDILLTCSGIAGLGICLFPCSLNSYSHEKVGTFLVDMQVSNLIHCACAVVFFALLAYNSVFLFTKSSGEITSRKKARNTIFRVCGVGMLISFAILLLPEFEIQIWLTETFALTFFGISFLTKANVFPFLFSDERDSLHLNNT